MQEENNEFLVELEKLLPSQIAMTKWAPNMDLLVIVTFDQALQLFRINYKAQRVFQTQQSKPIKTVTFSMDSHLIAYGMMDGTVKIVKSENGQKVVVVEGLHPTQIQSLTFADYHKLDPKLFMPFQSNSIQGKLILPVSPHKNCNKNAIIKINYFNHLTSEFVFLLSSQRDRTVFLLNGFIPVAEIKYEQIKLGKDIRVCHTFYDGSFKAVLVEDKTDSYELHLVEYETTVLDDYHEDIIKFHCLIGYVEQILNFVEGTFGAMQLQLREISSNYNSKMAQIDDSSIENINPCQQLFRFLNLGITSPPLVNFLTRSLFDSKAPQKLDETLTASFSKLHDLLLESTQNSLERAVVLLTRLKNMACSQRFRIFGILDTDIQEVSEKVRRVYNMTEILLVQSTQTKFDIRNLLVWLNKSAIKTSQQNDNEIENTKSYLNKYTVDYNRLHSFLQDQSRFNLQHLRAFFSKSNESSKMRIQPAEFRLLYSQKKQENPELESHFRKMQILLQVNDVILPQQPSSRNSQYLPFKAQLQSCIGSWKSITRKPLANISSLITRKHTRTSIGKLQFDNNIQLFPFQVKHKITESGHLCIYYVQREEEKDILVRYNCHLKERGTLWIQTHHIVSLAVGNLIIVQLEGKLQGDGHRVVVEVANQEFDGHEIIKGRIMSKVNGDVDIDSSLRGLNSMIENKTKLIIFD